MIISEKLSRRLFVAELIVFALVPTFALAAWTIFAGLPAVFMLLFATAMLVASILFDISETPGDMLQLMALSGGVAILAGMGATALVKFLWLSATFVRGGTAELSENRPVFWRSLAWAVVPLVATNAFIPGMTTVLRDERAFRFLSYGLTLGVPLFHLWAELHYRR